MEARKYDLEDRLVAFSAMIIEIVELLPQTRAGNYIAGQLIRCGLSPALNYGEAQGAESRDDFVHKMKIVLKELKETRVCLKMILLKALVKPKELLEAVKQENEALVAITAKGIITARQNQEVIGGKKNQ
jgi:four helix bundle protein